LPAVTEDASKLLDRRKKLMGSAYRLFYDQPLHLVRGEGVWLFDADGNKYLDMYNNVPHVGHCHSRVVDAICGVLTGAIGPHANILKLRCPMVLTRADADFALSILDGVLP
jgi:4-aminobutyrate aminotransferase-like enzyme